MSCLHIIFPIFWNFLLFSNIKRSFSLGFDSLMTYNSQGVWYVFLFATYSFSKQYRHESGHLSIIKSGSIDQCPISTNWSQDRWSSLCSESFHSIHPCTHLHRMFRKTRLFSILFSRRQRTVHSLSLVILRTRVQYDLVIWTLMDSETRGQQRWELSLRERQRQWWRLRWVESMTRRKGRKNTHFLLRFLFLML